MQHERLVHTLTAVAYPMLQAGTSTLFCVAPLILLEAYPPRVFLRAIFLVVTLGEFFGELVANICTLLGLLHGLFMLPVLMSSLPNCLTGGACELWRTGRQAECTDKELEQEDKRSALLMSQTNAEDRF